MQKSKPVILRRTSSNVVPQEPEQQDFISGSTTAAIPAAPGSGGVIDPEKAIPIADAESGMDELSYSTHKRKTSGLPLEVAAIYERASVQTSLDRITDEEEGGEQLHGASISLSRSFSEADMKQLESSGQIRAGGVPASPHSDSTPQGSVSSMLEFSEAFPEDNSNSMGKQLLRSVLTSRGVAGIALFVITIAILSMRGGSSTQSKPQVGVPIHPGSANTAEYGAEEINDPNPNSKEITMGEFHEETVGAPLEHHVNEYNKIRFFDSPDKMKSIVSKGPILWDDSIGGLHLFENVCLTNNIDAIRYRPEPDTSLRGLIYFMDENDELMKNTKRCVPCSNKQAMDDWDGASVQDEQVVGHKCGMNGIHAMFASSVGDWTNCIMQEENVNLMEKMGQTQTPIDVSTIHFFQEPTFLLQFNALDKEQSLFDMLMTYLPHWDKFLMTKGEIDVDAAGDDGGFPFNSVISHSIQGCLSHSHNWFCEILHQMYAFGEAKEIPWENDDNTLYCYRELFYNQVGYQRNFDHEGLVTKKNFGEFREMLFRKFGLPRMRTVEGRLAELEYEKTHGGQKTEGGDSSNISDVKIIFYDNKLTDQKVWNQMGTLISKARELEKYQHIKFLTVNKSFDDLTVAQQARLFNEADAVIMAKGQHMANAIFAVDGTSFVEVGCKVQSLIGNPKFMKLMGGKYRAVERCSGGGGGNANEASDVCAICKGEGEDSNFSMTPTMFEALIDDILASLQ